MTIFVQGSFKSTGVGVYIPVPAGSDYFYTFNQTQAATTQTTGRGVAFQWFNNPTTAAGSAYEWYKTNSTNAINLNYISSGGFTYYTGYPAPQAPVTGSAITNANPAVVTMTNTYSEGDTVVLYDTTGMEIIGGMSFTISSVSGSGFTLKGLDASGFASAATNVVARRIFPVAPVIPPYLYITSISQAAQAVVTVSQDPTNIYYVGQKLIFTIPSSFGMVELNNNNLQYNSINYPAVITAMNPTGSNVYQFTININTTNFTPFAFPASTLSPTAPAFATVAPEGSSTQYNTLTQTYTGYTFPQQAFRSGQEFPLMYLAAGAQSPAGSSGDIIIWQNWSAPVSQYQPNA